MQRNVGGFDRIARVLLGPVLLLAGGAAFAGALGLGTVLAAGSLVVGAILLGTGTTQKCPANELAGVDTTEQ